MWGVWVPAGETAAAEAVAAEAAAGMAAETKARALGPRKSVSTKALRCWVWRDPREWTGVLRAANSRVL